jgi:hypothetical protein
LDRTDRAAMRNLRIAQFSSVVSVRADGPGHEERAAAYERRLRADPAFAKRMADGRKRAIAMAVTYDMNGPNLFVDRYLRNFLNEFNNRIFMGEGANMPISFNVLRSFVDPDDISLVLKLLPERSFSVSLNRLLDHITDSKVDGALSRLQTELEELTVYEINMLGGFSDFILPGHEDFVFCGCGLVRENTELSIIALFGRKNPDRQVSKTPVVGSTAWPGKDFLWKDRTEYDSSDSDLFGDARFQPVILLTRIDLANQTTQARYVLEEQVEAFSIATDDPDTLEDLRQVANGQARIDRGLKTISEHAGLFALLNMMPSFCGRALEGIEDDFVVERHPTKIRIERDKPSVRRMLDRLPPREKPSYVDVSTLYELSDDGARYRMEDVGLVVETSGYWKTLPLGSAGKDKAGRPVQGKTWVQQQSNWFESQIATMAEAPSSIDVMVKVQADEQTGELYVMRSAQHPKHVYKIGFTTKSSQERADKLGATSGQPDVFHLVQSWRVRNPRAIEHQVHSLLWEFRLNKSREFFQLNYDKIRETIEHVIAQSKAFIID